MIGQLPKEAGGNYTTGAAKVVFELSKQKVDGIELFTYATNAQISKVKPYCKYPNQYIGYSTSIWKLLKDMLFHPLETFNEWKHFLRVDHENPLRYAFYKINIEKAIVMTHPDLIHVHSIGNVSVTRYAMGVSNAPLLLTCHGVFYRGDTNDIIGQDRYMGNLPMCDYYTGLTEEARIELSDILGIATDKYTIIPNGVDTSKFYFSEKWRKKVRMEMDIPEDTIVLITVASLQERKGQLAFIKILEELDVNYQYWMVGTGPDKSAIEHYVNEHYLADKVKLLGYHESDELYRYYSAADIYAHTSWKEGQALSEIEANATGLRIIVNKRIVGTIANLKAGDYYILDFSDFERKNLLEWIRKYDINRHSNTTLDWLNVAKKYGSLYQKLLSNIKTN